MRIEYLLSGMYLLLAFWFVPKIAFIKQAELTEKEARFWLGFKIMAGLIFAFYFSKVSNDVDYLKYNEEGKLQYELLISNPRLFFTDFTKDVDTYGLDRLFESRDSFWAYIRFNLLYKFLAILNLVSNGNFYLNSALFSSMVFFGHISFYRVYSDIYKGHKLKILVCCFCLPSLLMYTSCVHKDGIIFASLGLASYVFYRGILSRYSLNIKYISVFLLGTATIFLFRNYIIVAMLPAMLVTLISKAYSYKKPAVFLVTYSFFFLVFFLSGLSKSFNLPAAVVQRKADFEVLGEAKTNISMNELQPTPASFIVNFPQAINHSLFRPYLWEFPQIPAVLAALELFVYHVIILAFLFYRKKTAFSPNSFNLFGLSFFISMMLIIGYTIPNIGAIVRYRSIFWIYLVCPLVCNIDWERLPYFGKKTTNIA